MKEYIREGREEGTKYQGEATLVFVSLRQVKFKCWDCLPSTLLLEGKVRLRKGRFSEGKGQFGLGKEFKF